MTRIRFVKRLSDRDNIHSDKIRILQFFNEVTRTWEDVPCVEEE